MRPASSLPQTEVSLKDHASLASPAYYLAFTFPPQALASFPMGSNVASSPCDLWDGEAPDAGMAGAKNALRRRDYLESLGLLP